MTASEGEQTPICEQCGRPMELLGNLPAVNGRPAVSVYRCLPCGNAVSIETEKD